MEKRKPFFLVLLLPLILLVVGCSPSLEGKNVANGTENVLLVADTSLVTTWDPSSSFSTEVMYMGNIYETLIRCNPEGIEGVKSFSPLLAEDWDVSDDGLEWTFYLRKGVTFHDGDKLDANAVKTAIERTIQLNEGAAYIWAQVDRIDVKDELTIKFLLNEPVPFDRIVSSSNGAWIMSPTSVEKGKDWFEEGNAAGTGPYKLESYKPGEEVVFTSFDDYWGGWEENQFDRVVIKITSEAIVMRQLLESGEVHIAGTVPVESRPVLAENPKIRIYRGPSFYNYIGLLNTAKPPLDNVLVRQAVSYAIPYDDIIEIATMGYATQSQGPVPKGLWPWDASLPQYSYDLDKARQLLVEAGYSSGSLGGIPMVLTYAAENPSHERYSPLIKESLKEIGIDLEIRPILWTSQWALAKEGDPATEAQDIFLLLWWPSYADGYDNLSSMFTKDMYRFWNLTYWINPHYDDLIEEAYSLCVIDKEKSQELYSQAQRILIEEAVALFLFDPQDALQMSADIKGEPLNPCYPRVFFFYNLYK